MIDRLKLFFTSVKDTSSLQKEIQDQKNKANRLDISPLNPSVKKELLSSKKD